VSYFFLEKVSAGSVQSWRSWKTLSDSHGESCGVKSRPETLDRRREKEEAKKAVFARAMEMVDWQTQFIRCNANLGFRDREK
jgi:hypothetical protein